MHKFNSCRNSFLKVVTNKADIPRLTYHALQKLVLLSQFLTNVNCQLKQICINHYEDS